MDLKPFLSNANVWKQHFEDTTKKSRKNNNKFHVIQKGQGFPLNNVVSISPVKQAEQIAKSEMVQINRGHSSRKKRYKRAKKNKNSHNKRVSRGGKPRKSKKRILSHKKKRK